MEKDIKKVVAENVRALLGKTNGERGATAALIKLGIPNGDATRVLQGETSIGLDKLAQIAGKLRVQPWQLMTPDLDPMRLPSLEQSSFRWPYRQIDPDVFTGLSGLAAQQVESGVLVALATLGISPTKQPRVANG